MFGQSQLQAIRIDSTFYQNSEIFPFDDINTISSLSISGDYQLNSDTSLIRVLLVNDQAIEHLVYESYDLIVDDYISSFSDAAEETFLLPSSKPISLRIEIYNASIHISTLSISTTAMAMDANMEAIQSKVKEAQQSVKIAMMNKQLNNKGMKWVAGKTSVSSLSYEEKKRLFGRDTLPSLQGFLYYKGGVFELKTLANNLNKPVATTSSLVESWDWRNRHGANNPSSPYYDSDPLGSGWLTSVKNQGGCGSCWAFAATGATEALTNLYFNRHLDLNLAEQDALSCSGAGDCSGGLPSITLDYYVSTGVVDENCFPYTASDQSCINKCTSPNELIKINGREDFTSPKTEDKLKKLIIDYGPLSGGLYNWSHAMTLPGFHKVQEGDIFYFRDVDGIRSWVTINSGDPLIGTTVWIFKNSWGENFGDDGYVYVETDIENIGWTHALKTPITSLNYDDQDIRCLDLDGDGYYNWGIGDKPASCPDCSDERDCDDSDPQLGPIDADGNCIVNNPEISGYITQSNGSAISGVTVTFDNEGGTDVTDANGYYSEQVPYGWTGTATPSHSGWSFVPDNISYTTSVTVNQDNQDFIGTILNPCISGSIIYNTESGKFNFCEGGIWVEKNGSTTIFDEQFSTDVFGNGDWVRSDASVTVNTSDGWLHIGTDGGYDGYAEKTVSLPLPITVESRMKLVSGGNNYRLPALELYYSTTDYIQIIYLSNKTPEYGGWRFQEWTLLETKAPPSEDYWVTVKAIIRTDGGELLAKFDGEGSFTSIITKSWSIPSTIIKIKYGQPWDAVCEIDYISVY